MNWLFCRFAGDRSHHLINLFTRPLATILGANDQTMGMAIKYLRLMSIDAPVTMANYISVNFIRNDNHPGLTMRAALIESFVVIIFDWFFILACIFRLKGPPWQQSFRQQPV